MNKKLDRYQKSFCSGKNTKGEPCKLKPEKKSKYCRFHDPKNLYKKEEIIVRDFFRKHKEGILGFLGGSISDPIVSDIYDFVKEKTGMKHLVPPESQESPEKILIEYRKDKDATSLWKVIPFIEIGMSSSLVQKLLGKPDNQHIFNDRVVRIIRITYSYFAYSRFDVALNLEFYDDFLAGLCPNRTFQVE